MQGSTYYVYPYISFQHILPPRLSLSALCKPGDKAWGEEEVEKKARTLRAAPKLAEAP